METKESITGQIKKRILSSEKGSLYFISDFSDIQNNDLVTKILSRLAAEGILVKLANGIYLYPQTNHFGINYPSLYTIAKAIAKRDNAQIMPTGNTALNQLGISTQVPMNNVYLTTGSSRTIQIGKRKITFKHSVPKHFAYQSQIVPLIVFSMKELGENKIDDNFLRKVEEIIDKAKEREEIEQDILLAPVWIQNKLKPIINKNR